MSARRKRVANAFLSESVADMDRLSDLFLDLLLEEAEPPPREVNHLETRMVRENSLREVLSLLGPSLRKLFWSYSLLRCSSGRFLCLCAMCGDIVCSEDFCVMNAGDDAEALFLGEATAMAARRQHLRILLINRF